jgi:AcrR family transcriptional regulator
VVQRARAAYLGPEKRRPMVLDAALEIFAEGGFADASMAAVAERAGVSKAVLYDCFPNGKQEIYEALLERGEQRFLDHMMGVLTETARMPMKRGLHEGLDAFLRYAEMDPLGFQVVFGEAGSADPEIIKRSAATRERIVKKMDERTRELFVAANMPFTPLFEIYNRVIIAAAEEMARWIIREPKISREEVVPLLVAWWMSGFDVIMPPAMRNA